MKKLLLTLLLLTLNTSFAGTQLIIKTSMGDMEIELFDKKSPESVRNFLQYVDEGFYTDTLFHRVIKGYIIQGGGLDLKLNRKKTHPKIRNEALNMVKNLKGTIAMARTKHKHTAKSEFFINLKDNPNLDHQGLGQYGYAVFGKVTKGLDIALNIGNVKVEQNGPYRKVPKKQVIVKSISRKK